MSLDDEVTITIERYETDMGISEAVLNVQLTSDMGPPGPKGDTGDTGPQGPQGPQGPVDPGLAEHIASESPHLVYDDGTSFLLRYENAKV